ncbi:MAG: hypothetical protein GY830_00110 [Bacteroidetes bacterium]|nr:hypothetical protein [Bacteroidota bacterium]
MINHKTNFISIKLHKLKSKYIYHTYKKIFIIIVISFFYRNKIYAKSLDLLIMHTTIHPEPLFGKKLEGKNDMPYRMDEEAIFTFTPGIGIIYDSRINEEESSWSTIYGTHFNFNCYGTAMLGAGIGKRYKFFFTKKLSFNLSLMLEFLIISRNVLPIYTFEDNKFCYDLANLIMHNIPNTNHKIIFPTPIIDFSFTYKMESGSYLNLNMMWSGAAIAAFVGITIPAEDLVERLKKANPPKRRKILNYKRT